jgi:signal peptidase I
MNWFRRHKWIVAIAAIVIITPAYLRLYRLTGSSAAPTILLGDNLVVNRAAYDLMLPYSRMRLGRTGSPKRGDLVLALIPGGAGTVFKRVMGLPGETIEMRENQIFVDGKAIPLRHLNRADFMWVPPTYRIGTDFWDEDGHWIAFTPEESRLANQPAITLKDNQYFLLGDNRDHSLDCRQWGPLSRDHILGKIIFILPTGPRARLM